MQYHPVLIQKSKLISFTVIHVQQSERFKQQKAIRQQNKLAMSNKIPTGVRTNALNAKDYLLKALNAYLFCPIKLLLVTYLQP